ncbi:MAG: hypothetical protein Q8L15_01345 [Methylobacter sp.]|nr:hypothetical protein [Methylobacter sp.]
MIDKVSAVFIATVITVFLTACAKETPKCSDDETVSLVRKIILDQIGGSEKLSEEEIKENMKIELPRATAFDEKIKKYSCEAKLKAGNSYVLPITYESQLDDANQHIVAVGGINRADLFNVSSWIAQSIEKGRAEKDTSTKPTEIQPTPEPKEQPIIASTTEPTEKQIIAPPTSATEPATEPSTEKAQDLQQVTWTPSFDCKKASTFSEKTICSDPLLGKLDGALSENYKYMLGSDIGDGARSELKSTQKTWLSDRNKCKDSQCLIDSYKKRIDEVCEYPVISGIHPECTSSSDIK